MTIVSYAQKGSVLSYEDYLNNVLQNSPLAKRAENEQQYGALQYKAARGNYDPVISSDYNEKQFNGSHYFTNLQVEVKQPLFTSQYLRFGYDYGAGSYLNPELNTPSNGLSYLGLEVALLQGLLIDKRRAEVLKSKEYQQYYKAEKQAQINVLLLEASQHYFEWLFSIKQISLYTYFMGAADQRLAGIKELTNIGEKAAMDTIEAAIFFQARLLDMQNARIENQKSINAISFYNWQNNGLSFESEILEPADSLEVYYNKLKFLVSEGINQNGGTNPVLLKYQSFQRVLEIENRLKKEMIKPYVSIKYNFILNNSYSLNPVLSGKDYKVGLQISFPLFLRNPVNEYRMSRIHAENNAFELLNKTNELNVKMTVLKQTLALLNDQLKNAERSVLYSKLLVEAEKLKFDAGESSLFLLNTRENKWLESELKLSEYKLKYIKTALNLIYLAGTLEYAI